MALPAQNFSSFSSFSSPKVQVRSGHVCCFNCSFRAQAADNGGNKKRIWRRRKLTKKDDKSEYKMERIPFLEEQVRKIREVGKLVTMDIEKLMLREDNRFDFVNEIAAEAKSYVESNPDKYGGKRKAILQVLSNRINEAGFYRPDAYAEDDPFKPGPNYLREDIM